MLVPIYLRFSVFIFIVLALNQWNEKQLDDVQIHAIYNKLLLVRIKILLSAGLIAQPADLQSSVSTMLRLPSLILRWTVHLIILLLDRHYQNVQIYTGYTDSLVILILFFNLSHLYNSSLLSLYHPWDFKESTVERKPNKGVQREQKAKDHGKHLSCIQIS